MRYEVKTLSKAENRLQFFPDAEEMAQGQERAAKAVSKQVSLPGFRKGKVPLSVVKQRYKDHIDEMFAESFVFEFLPKVLEEKGWSVLEPGVFIEKDEKAGTWRHADGSIAVRLEILPQHEIKIPKIELLPEEVKVEEPEVQQEIETLRQRLSDLKSIEGDRAAQPGDVLLLKELKPESVLSSDQVSSSEESEADKNLFRYEVQPPQDQKADDFVGIRVGEIRQVEWDTEAETEDKKLTGHKVSRKFLCKEIAMRVLPDITDDFCKRVGTFENLDALKAAIRKEITGRKVRQIRDKNRSTIIEAMVQANDVAIPQGLEHRMLSEQIRQTVHSLTMFQVPEDRMKTYLEQHQESLKKSAQERSKFHVISAIYARDRGIVVPAGEVVQAWEHLNSQEQKADRLLEDAQRVRLKQMLLEEKVLDALQKTVQAT